MFRPHAKILAVTKLNSVARELSLLRNLNVMQVDTFDYPNELADFVIKQSLDRKFCEINDDIILIQGEKGTTEESEIKLLNASSQ